ncbi:hypothetical protein EGR_09800 [Echinococcus granulosus]|uniref:DUF5726 domain-containing protein n=1 Tax=Echinococcus granulosus TaxID=6210 RepID=W6UA28_ECHGR|nr:hypothetical protein EGR_09800 [Echinococcus granulosus]EUB55332.1 hypothetical protein EGR_09800 [Echinococcus granulosus]
MLKLNQPGCSRRTEKRREETCRSRSTLVAALAGLPPFAEDMNSEDWLITTKFDLHLYPQCQRIPLIVRALAHDLFVAAVGAGITHDTDIDQCCDTLTQHIIDREEQTLVRDLFLLFQKADEDDEVYAKNLQLLAKRVFHGCLPNKVANWTTVQFRHGV